MKSSLLLTIAGAVGVFGLVLWYGTRTPERQANAPVTAPTRVAAGPPSAGPPGAAPVSVAPPVIPAPAHALAPSRGPPAIDAVARWSADVNSGDPGRRAAAIAALAHAPRAQAVPVLARVATNGDPTLDRKLALQALRDLASEQGDADGAIRAAVRAVIYHSDDYAPVAEAQETLDAIERAQAK